MYVFKYCNNKTFLIILILRVLIFIFVRKLYRDNFYEAFISGSTLYCRLIVTVSAKLLCFGNVDLSGLCNTLLDKKPLMKE